MPLPDPARPTSFSALLRNLLIAIAYVALGAFSLAFATAEGYASPIFPAAGLALAVALRFGRSALPGIWIGSASLNLGLAVVSGTLSPTTAAVAIPNDATSRQRTIASGSPNALRTFSPRSPGSSAGSVGTVPIARKSS